MNINRQILAHSFLAFSALMRTFDPAPTKPPKLNNYESQVKVDKEQAGKTTKQKSPKTSRKFHLSRGRVRRPYIQFEDGSYKVL